MKNMDQFLTQLLDQFLTQKPPNLGPNAIKIVLFEGCVFEETKNSWCLIGNLHVTKQCIFAYN